MPKPLEPQMVATSSVDVETLIVFATNRGPGIAWDVINGLLWGCEASAHLVVVDDSQNVAPVGTHGDVTIIHSQLVSRKELSGFKTHEGVKHAIEQGMKFKRVWVVDDDALVIAKGLDTWAAETMQFGNIDLLGVEDRVNYQNQWGYGYHFFHTVGTVNDEITHFHPDPATIFYAVNFMSRNLAMKLYEKNLLIPPGYEKWELWPDIYISWAANILRCMVTCWGHMDRPRVPIYADHPDHQRTGGPEPRILHPDFKVFHSTKAVRGYSELELRQHYRDVRARDGWTPLGPPEVLPEGPQQPVDVLNPALGPQHCQP